MAIKRLRLNDQGRHEERTLETSELPPPPPKPEKSATRVRPLKLDSGGGGSSIRSSASMPSTVKAPASGPVKTTRIAKKFVPSGRTLLDEGVIRYGCTTCETTRIVKEVGAKPPSCSLCNKPMRLQTK